MTFKKMMMMKIRKNLKRSLPKRKMLTQR